MTGVLAILSRELRLSVRHGADTLAAVLFFLLIVSLFPFAIGPAPETLGRMAPGIIWVSALLSAFLSLDRLFGADFEDGSLDQLLLSGVPGIGIAAAKTLAHWIVTGLPLLLAAAPLAVMLRMPEEAIPALLAGLLPGTALLSLFGTTGAAIVVGARRAGNVAAVTGAAARHARADFRRGGGGRRGDRAVAKTAFVVAGGSADGGAAVMSAGRRCGVARCVGIGQSRLSRRDISGKSRQPNTETGCLIRRPHVATHCSAVPPPVATSLRTGRSPDHTPRGLFRAGPP